MERLVLNPNLPPTLPLAFESFDRLERSAGPKSAMPEGGRLKGSGEGRKLVQSGHTPRRMLANPSPPF
eukprot:1279832-Pyramimonas_sp.AAC.1